MNEIQRNDAIEALDLLLRFDTVTDSQIILKRPLYSGAGTALAVVDLAEVWTAVDKLAEATIPNNAGLQWTDGCEYLVVRNSGRLGSQIPREISSQDENGLVYSIGGASLAFTIKALHAVKRGEIGRPGVAFTHAMRRLRDSSIFASGQDEIIEQVSSLESILEDAGFLTTLKIRSAKPRNDFKEIAEAFLFGLAYNYDTSYLAASDLYQVLGDSRPRRRGRVAGAMDAPRMVYTSDLVHHYQLAVSADSPMLKYLSYYHVLEHFFEKVFKDDLIEQVRRKIADPSFSLARADDVQRVIKVIASSQRQVREEGGVDEQKSLYLVLDGYLDISRLVADVTSHDSDLIDYYKGNSPSFIESSFVDLRHDQREKINKALAKRIYQTRNSLVHAKEGARPKYFPFVNDSELSREIPLLRFIAEQVIIANGRVI